MPTQLEVDAMRHAIALSALGLGTTSPNPPVGCMILDPVGQVVGTGYHRRKGEAHAEARALTAAGQRAAGGTAVVTLEPCNHVGITPACRQALIDAGIVRVVIAVIDPTSRGEGGAAVLSASGIDVEIGVLDDEARTVLGPWLLATERKRPFVTWLTGSPHQDHTAASTDDLRQGHDLVIHANGRIEEGIPSGHGKNMMHVPSDPVDADGPSVLKSLFEGGARTVLVLGDSLLSRSLLDTGRIDVVVVEQARIDTSEALATPHGYRIAQVTTTSSAVRITSHRKAMSPDTSRA